MSQVSTTVQQANPAQIYERFLVTHQFRPFARELVARAAPQPGERVLDIACGTGVVARLAAPLVGPTGRVTGLDLSPGMLAVGRERAEAEGLSIAWREGNAATLPFEDGTFDIVLCHQGLQFFPDQPAALREMRRVLASGGRALVSSWSPVATSPVNLILDQAVTKYLGFSPGAVPFGLGGADRLGVLMREGGFTEVAVAPVVLTLRWPSYMEFVRGAIAGATAAVPALAAMTPAERDTLVRAFVEGALPQLTEYIDGEALNCPLQTDIALARQ
jgi:ubiquinone/menaquinone biosynthesis C-methylase UbiE